MGRIDIKSLTEAARDSLDLLDNPAANPDIRNACQGVYVRNNKLYAKVNIELLRVSGNRLTFQTRWTDGGTGKARSITVPASWRARIGGRSYAASELQAGQELSVYVPEDRFALGLDNDESGLLDLFPVEEEAPPR